MTFNNTLFCQLFVWVYHNDNILYLSDFYFIGVKEGV